MILLINGDYHQIDDLECFTASDIFKYEKESSK